MLSRPPSSSLFIRTPVTVTMPNTTQISVVVQMFFFISWNLCVESSRKKKLTVVSTSTCLLSQKVQKETSRESREDILWESEFLQSLHDFEDKNCTQSLVQKYHIFPISNNLQ